MRILIVGLLVASAAWAEKYDIGPSISAWDCGNPVFAVRSGFEKFRNSYCRDAAGVIQKDMHLWYASLFTLAGAAALDTHSSLGREELNPVLGRGPFGTRQIATKGGITAGIALAQYMAVRKWPRSARVFRWVNFGAAGATAGVAVRNYSTR